VQIRYRSLSGLQLGYGTIGSRPLQNEDGITDLGGTPHEKEMAAAGSLWLPPVGAIAARVDPWSRDAATGQTAPAASTTHTVMPPPRGDPGRHLASENELMHAAIPHQLTGIRWG
jgi:hypothetical protein